MKLFVLVFVLAAALCASAQLQESSIELQKRCHDVQQDVNSILKPIKDSLLALNKAVDNIECLTVGNLDGLQRFLTDFINIFKWGPITSIITSLLKTKIRIIAGIVRFFLKLAFRVKKIIVRISSGFGIGAINLVTSNI